MELPKGWIELTNRNEFSDSRDSKILYINASYIVSVLRKEYGEERYTIVNMIDSRQAKVYETPEWILKEISEAEAEHE